MPPVFVTGDVGVKGSDSPTDDANVGSDIESPLDDSDSTSASASASCAASSACEDRSTVSARGLRGCGHQTGVVRVVSDRARDGERMGGGGVRARVLGLVGCCRFDGGRDGGLMVAVEERTEAVLRWMSLTRDSNVVGWEIGAGLVGGGAGAEVKLWRFEATRSRSRGGTEGVEGSVTGVAVKDLEREVLAYVVANDADADSVLVEPFGLIYFHGGVPAVWQQSGYSTP